ncbi:hypothetical protein OJAV_G00211800 [Oryzias javanicus]|uniref:Uncharacterized protein n=1 Tax=Oryzias javanicus TaxID=123683 RepID=A0A3S2TWF2_ORYJA|nr:hypothetical protein OJAV_G00211800 [Oryzias javanicus]
MVDISLPATVLFEKICPGTWTEITAKHVVAALYVVLDEKFDYSIITRHARFAEVVVFAVVEKQLFKQLWKNVNKHRQRLLCPDVKYSPDSTWFGKPVEEEEILSLFPDNMIKVLHEDLTTGKVRSNRMYLQNPMSSLPLKQHLKPRTLNLNDHRIFQLLRAIEDATGVRSFIQKEEVQILDHVFDVMLPEISILTNQGKTRLQAEILLARGSIF